MSMESAPGTGDITIYFEGRAVNCRPGVSVAAALAAAGEYQLRDTAQGGMRGVFCGMGVCQECRMIIDGRPGMRACMTAVSESLQVSRQPERVTAEAPAGPVTGGGEREAREPELLIVGAGPAGLTAASVAAESGAEVVLVDERAIAGGQYYKQPLSPERVHESLAGDRQFADGRSLIERARQSGATILSGAEVWGAFAPNDFAVFDGERSIVYKPRAAIVAAGAYERGLPLPGWTLPGVMTTGAAQSLLRSYGVLAGKRVLVAGNGPFNLQVALELRRAGAELVAVAELAARPGPRSLPAALRMLRNGPGPTVNGMRYLAGLRAARVPVLYRHGLASIEQAGGGLRARVGRIDGTRIAAATAYDVDVVCMGYGFQPNNDILRCLGCSHDYDGNRGHLVTQRNAACETSVPGIYAIGDCCGLGGAMAALEEGTIAATAVLRSLDRRLSPEQLRQERTALGNLRRHRAFQSGLWRLFSAPRFQHELAAADTTLCRCENVTLAQVEAALADGHASIGAVKRCTRLGMGPCQGRYCAPVAAQMVAERSGRPLDEFSLFAPQSPLKPIRIADLVGPAAP